jgi:cytochrome d ubiquinol oxidase subunit I
MRTADSVTPSLSPGEVALSLVFYMIVYLIMFPAGIAFMAMQVRAGVEDVQVQPLDRIEAGRPATPFDASAHGGISGGAPR